ncbi:hypothetical protein Pyn_14598 [Prunus yedoensis var. nudiflora]|uniref:Uncharacterized protein n=1 Tax=Prunus yedoensis var. nudiflora TaxID=2094558 RepID=A0A314ZPU6_PRUYE|nr:hypothetical protein Pyn_14598 [Prunus yedoensis var. nudiflora]
MSSSHEKGDEATKPTQGGGEGSSSSTKRDPNCLYVIKRKPGGGGADTIFAGGGVDTIFAKVDPAEFEGLEALYVEVLRRVESAYTMGKGRVSVSLEKTLEKTYEEAPFYNDDFSRGMLKIICKSALEDHDPRDDDDD